MVRGFCNRSGLYLDSPHERGSMVAISFIPLACAHKNDLLLLGAGVGLKRDSEKER